jgi:hypothetical protein
LGSSASQDQFLLETITSEPLRRERIARLCSDAFPYRPDKCLEDVNCVQVLRNDDI